MSHWKDFLDAGARGGRYLPWKEVGRATGLSRTTAWRLQRRGEFPAPYAISPGRVGYREDEVEAWRVSRDHSATRAGAADATISASRPEVPAPIVAAVGPADTVPPPVAAGTVARSSPRREMAAVSAKRGKPGRRRSQHAQAIAQQILFDF